MSQLKLLWELHKHDMQLSKLKENLEEIQKDDKIEELSIRLKEKEYDLTNKKTQIDVNDMKIQRYDQKLKQLNFDIKNTEDKMYSGKITNFKQLEQLQKDSLKAKSEVKKIENEMLKLMDSSDKLTSEIKAIEKDFNKLNEKIQECKNKYEIKLLEIQGTIKEEKICLDRLLEKTDQSLVEKFNQIKNKKHKAVAKVQGDKCTGCHMAIPTSILSKLRNNDNIIYCDNCGRILYYEDYEEK